MIQGTIGQGRRLHGLPQNRRPTSGPQDSHPNRQAGQGLGQRCASERMDRLRSNCSAEAKTKEASAQFNVKIEIQSRDRQAGTTPRVLSAPRVGLSPTTLLNPAGTRPDPAVSVPRENDTSPAETATAEPLLDPPGISLASKGLRGVPYGERVPTSPVANWSRFVLPIGIAPAAKSLSTTGADVCGVKENAGHPAVVGVPARSMLSLIAKGMP